MAKAARFLALAREAWLDTTPSCEHRDRVADDAADTTLGARTCRPVLAIAIVSRLARERELRAPFGRWGLGEHSGAAVDGTRSCSQLAPQCFMRSCTACNCLFSSARSIAQAPKKIISRAPHT